LAVCSLFIACASNKLFFFIVTTQPSSETPLSQIQIPPRKRTGLRHALLGFIGCAYWGWASTRRQAILYSILFGEILSFVIEVLQAYIPQRYSGTTDIITNTLGAALGAVLVRPSMVRTILDRTSEGREEERATVR
jgi:VanZ family protein